VGAWQMDDVAATVEKMWRIRQQEAGPRDGV
jgi:hypothetical protein